MLIKLLETKEFIKWRGCWGNGKKKKKIAIFELVSLCKNVKEFHR